MESSWGSGLPDARLLRRPARGRIAFGDPRRRAGGAERRHRPARVRPVLLGAPREVRPEEHGFGGAARGAYSRRHDGLGRRTGGGT